MLKHVSLIIFGYLENEDTLACQWRLGYSGTCYELFFLCIWSSLMIYIESRISNYIVMQVLGKWRYAWILKFFWNLQPNLVFFVDSEFIDEQFNFMIFFSLVICCFTVLCTCSGHWISAKKAPLQAALDSENCEISARYLDWRCANHKALARLAINNNASKSSVPYNPRLEAPITEALSMHTVA